MSSPIFRQIPLRGFQRSGIRELARRLAGFAPVYKILSAILLVALFASTGCEDLQRTQTQAFEYAEKHYRGGQYDAALDGYQAFLESYPTSPLAATAEMRIRCIHREVRSVMMQKNVPRPRYVGESNKPTASRIAIDSDGAAETAL
jgi:outer membrane protein assembly factor BamD (BamD/ComL family)